MAPTIFFEFSQFIVISTYSFEILKYILYVSISRRLRFSTHCSLKDLALQTQVTGWTECNSTVSPLFFEQIFLLFRQDKKTKRGIEAKPLPLFFAYFCEIYREKT